MITFSVPDMLSVLSLLVGSGAIIWLFRLVAILATITANEVSSRRDINTIMSFLFNRAKTELVTSGLADMHSPIVINVSCFEGVMPFLGKFIPFYLKIVKKYPDLHGYKLDKILFIEFENEFGDFIVEKICIPMHVNQGACLLAVIKACQQMQNVEPKEVSNA